MPALNLISSKYELFSSIYDFVFILGLAGSVMSSCLGHKHLYCMYILAQDQNGLVRSNTKDLCFSSQVSPGDS